MMKRIAIIHYLPLEFYPPVTNFLDCLGSVNVANIKVFSTHNSKGRTVYTNDEVSNIFRSPRPLATDNRLVKFWRYFNWNIAVFSKLVFCRPNIVMYYETFSVLPVVCYMMLFRSSTKLIIHYHEYNSKDWYANSSKLIKVYHRLEQKYLYSLAAIITQTNDDRIRLFLEDNSSVSKLKMGEFPNYPPKSFHTSSDGRRLVDGRVRIVYVGTLSLQSTYIVEFCDWVIAQNGNVLFDIFGYNVDEETMDFLEKLSCSWIVFNKEGVDYYELPKILNRYDVGVILYKGLTDNFRFNAPNKLFEYMACGLEVWYSDMLLGINKMRKDTYPRIIPVDFTSIPEGLLSKEEILNFIPHKKFYAEHIYEPMITKFIRSI